MSAEHRKWDIFSTQEVSKQLVFYDVMFYFDINTNEIANHFTLTLVLLQKVQFTM